MVSYLSGKGRQVLNSLWGKLNWITETTSSYTTGPKFEVYINAGEYHQISDWVLKFPRAETGGDLFGLWIDRHKCVVQLVLGPGNSCRRTDTSFHQDTSYLENIGRFLSEKHGLCNIGQWHSHHCLNLKEPSRGDISTVWNNLPATGLNAFVVFIATIEGTHERPFAEVNCFLFELDAVTGSRLPVVQGEFKIIEGNNPLRLHHEVYQKICQGAESINKIIITHSELRTLKAQNVSVHEDKDETGSETDRPTDKRKANDFENQGVWIQLEEMGSSVEGGKQLLNGEHASENRGGCALSGNEVRASRKNDGKGISGHTKETLLMIFQNSSNSERKVTVNGVQAEETKVVKDNEVETEKDNGEDQTETTYDNAKDQINIGERGNSSVEEGYRGEDGCLAEDNTNTELQQRSEIHTDEVEHNHATMNANVQEASDGSEHIANQVGKDKLGTSIREQGHEKTDDKYTTDNNDKNTPCKETNINEDPERKNGSEGAKKPNHNHEKNTYTEVNANGREMSVDNRGGMENGSTNYEERNGSTNQRNKPMISSKHDNNDQSLTDGGKTAEHSDTINDEKTENWEGMETHL